MSDNWLQLVPVDPGFQPSAAAAEQALALFASFVPKADDVRLAFEDHTEIFHPMANWSGVDCPACGADAEPWWQAAVVQSAQAHFEDLLVTAPCCGARVSLNDLDYRWPVAFGRFVLEALNPHVMDLSPAQEEALSGLLGCAFRKVWVHL